VRERDINAKKFHKGHYEIIAGRFREALEPYLAPGAVVTIAALENDVEVSRLFGARNALIDLALRMSVRFQADNEDFDPVIFLNRCSPNVDEYPLAELWDDYLSDGHSVKVVESD